jgi:1-acyl-sn-glycerol-3-phosphate acyltransferase
VRLIAWIRVLAFAVTTLVMAGLAVCGRGVIKPFSGAAAARWAAHCCRLWCRSGCAALGVPRQIRGRPPAGVFLAASNHLSYLDILVLGSLWPGVFVAKQEIASWPLFGLAARAAGTIFISRESPREIVQAGRRMAASLAAGVPVTLFPEGRITSGASVLPFLAPLLAPAARDGVPCHAVTVNYRVSDPGVEPSTQVCWPTSDPLLPHVLGVAGMRDLVARVDIDEHPVIDADRKELARALHARVASRFVPVPQPTAEAEPGAGDRGGNEADGSCAP